MKKTIQLFCYLVLLLGFAFNILAQTGADNNVVFDQFFQNYYLLNPASVDSSHRGQVSVGNRSLVGLFDGVNRLYVDGDLRLQKKIANQFSRIGIIVLAFNDGAFIKKTRVYGRYNWSTRLGMRSSISAGLALGFVNYSFSASQAGGGGSSTVFDGNIGVWYMRRKLKIGLAYQQMVHSILTPVNQSFELIPYLNVNAIYTSNLGAHLSLTTNMYFRIQNEKISDFQIAPVFLLHDKFETGINFRYQKGIALLCGVKALAIGMGQIRFMGSFLFSTQKLANNMDNTFELSAGYEF